MLDGDDLWMPRSLLPRIAYLDACPDCVAVGGACRVVDPDLLPISAPPAPAEHDAIVAAMLQGTCAIAHSSVVMRAEAVRRVGGYADVPPAEPQCGEDLDLFLPLLAQHGTGQHITVYNNIVFGPQSEFEPDGPEEMYVILLDNRRTELLKFKEQRRALSCIRCGACLNGCPIYRSVGGYTYNTTYSGPIGSVISPHYRGMKEYNHLSFASSLCGKCTEVCPVRIPLHELLLHNRHEAVMKKYVSFTWRFIVSGWKMVMLHRWMIDKPKSGLKNKMINRFGKNMWGPRRSLPKIAPKSFRELWKETHP